MLSQASIIPLWHLSCFTMSSRLLLAECISRTLGDKAIVTSQQGVILFSIQVLSFQINLHFLKLQHSVDRVLPSWDSSHWPMAEHEVKAFKGANLLKTFSCFLVCPVATWNYLLSSPNSTFFSCLSASLSAVSHFQTKVRTVSSNHSVDWIPSRTKTSSSKAHSSISLKFSLT